MDASDLILMERTHVVLGVAATVLSGLRWGLGGAAAAAAGAALAFANFWAVRRLAQRALARAAAGGSSRQASLLVCGLLAKMAALFGLVWVAVRLLRLAALPFSLGFSAFVLSILLVGFMGAAAAGAKA